MSSYSPWWSFQDFCDEQQLLPPPGWRELPPSTQGFLYKLNLTVLHPFCSFEDSTNTLVFPNAPPMGPPTEPYSTNWLEEFVTLFYWYIPPYLTFVKLWAVLLSGWIAPLGLAFQLGSLNRPKQTTPWSLFLATSTLFFCWLVMTDDSYVLEFGRLYGVFLVLLGMILMMTGRNNVRIFPIFCLFVLFDIISPWSLFDPERVPAIEPGLYYNTQNAWMDRIVQIWKKELPDYGTVGTPWQFTGDTRTGIPYMMNSVEEVPKFHRVWLPTEDSEYLAVDIAFPASGHDPTNPLYLILHGLNGGSAEGYVTDFTASRIKAGSTVVVMVARGLMDTPIQGWTIFNGIRTTDVHTAATTLRERVLSPGQILAGVGYSMGAIVLNKYVSSYEERVALDVSVSISGALYTVAQSEYRRSRFTWQRMIAAHMKDTFMYRKWGEKLYRKLGRENYNQLMRAQSVVEVDHFVGEMYDGYDNLTHFYAEMSSVLPNNATHNRIAIPHLILQSFDDPISTWTCNAANDPTSPLHPKNLVFEHQDNLVLLLTAKGGHVGWPIGWWPNSWSYMNDCVAAGFISSYQTMKKQVKDIEYRIISNVLTEINSRHALSSQDTCPVLSNSTQEQTHKSWWVSEVLQGTHFSLTSRNN